MLLGKINNIYKGYKKEKETNLLALRLWLFKQIN